MLLKKKNIQAFWGLCPTSGHTNLPPYPPPTPSKICCMVPQSEDFPAILGGEGGGSHTVALGLL